MDKEQLIKKWLNNSLSDTELKDFNSLEDAKLYKEIVEEAQRFNGNINATVEPFSTIDKRLAPKKSASLRWIRLTSGFAAALILGFALFTLFNNKDLHTYKTDLAQNEIITLPDHSIVNLNELSELQYMSSNWDNRRVLELKGEAFFDVEKGNNFEVVTKFGKVSVLGTEFNVYSRDSVFTVSCYEGLVQVLYANSSVKLPAGTEFVLSSGKGIKSNIAIAEPYWLRNMSVFENALFDDVVKELKKQYKIEVEYPTNLKTKFTGAFEHDNLENALKSVTKPLNLTYSLHNNNKVLIRNGQN